MQKKYLLLLSVFVLCGLLFLLSISVSWTKIEPEKNENSIGSTNTKLTPFPFQELTIPYLRSKTYSSNLEELEFVSSHGNYTSYKTSYDSEGNTIYGQLTIPNGQKPTKGWPAIIFIHGYIPPLQYETFERYVSYVDYLASRNFVVFKIDLRGHGNSEGQANGAYYSSDYIIDTLNAYNALQNADFVNKNSIGLWGHSMAGNVVLRSVVVKKDIPAVVIWAGSVFTYEDFQDYRIQDSSYVRPSEDSERSRRRSELFDTYGEFSANSDFWQQVVPTNYLDDIISAVQLHHAIDDSVVSIDYSRNLNKIFDETHIVHELYEYQSAGHNIEGVSFGVAMDRTVTFFNQYLRSE